MVEPLKSPYTFYPKIGEVNGNFTDGGFEQVKKLKVGGVGDDVNQPISSINKMRPTSIKTSMEPGWSIKQEAAKLVDRIARSYRSEGEVEVLTNLDKIGGVGSEVNQKIDGISKQHDQKISNNGKKASMEPSFKGVNPVYNYKDEK